MEPGEGPRRPYFGDWRSRGSAPDIRAVGDIDAQELRADVPVRAHSADNSPTLPLRVPPPPLYTRAEQAPTSSTLTIPARPSPPPLQALPPVPLPQVDHSPEHATSQDTHLPPLPESRPLSAVTEERVAQWLSQDAANQASRRSSDALPSQMPIIPSITVNDSGRLVSDRAERQSVGNVTSNGSVPRISLSPDSIDRIADRITLRIAHQLPSYHSQAGSSERILDDRLNPAAPLSLDRPPSSYRLGSSIENDRMHQHNRINTTQPSSAQPSGSALHLDVPSQRAARRDDANAPSPRGTDVSQPTATGWMESYYQNPRTTQTEVSPRHVDATQRPSSSEPLRCTCPVHPNTIRPDVDRDRRPANDYSLASTAASSNPIRVTRKVSTTPPKLEPTANPRPLIERLRDHVRAHPETGMVPTPDPVAEVGMAFEAGPELSEVTRRADGGTPAQGANAEASKQSSRAKRSSQAATVETVYAGSDRGVAPSKANTAGRRAYQNDHNESFDAAPRRSRVSSEAEGNAAAQAAQSAGRTDTGAEGGVRRPARNPNDSRGYRAQASDNTRLRPVDVEATHALTSKTHRGHSPAKKYAGDNDRGGREDKGEANRGGDSRADQRTTQSPGSHTDRRPAFGDPDIIEIPRRNVPDRPAERPRVVSYTYVGDLDFADLYTARNREPVPGESYRRTSVTRKGKTGDTKWRIDDDEYETRERRDTYATAPVANKSRTRTVITEHTDVFGHIVRNEKTTTISVRPGRGGSTRPRASLPVEIPSSSSSEGPSPPATRRGRSHRAGMMTAVPMVPLEMVDPRMVLQFGLPMAWSRSKGSWYM